MNNIIHLVYKTIVPSVVIKIIFCLMIFTGLFVVTPPVFAQEYRLMSTLNVFPMATTTRWVANNKTCWSWIGGDKTLKKGVWQVKLKKNDGYKAAICVRNGKPKEGAIRQGGKFEYCKIWVRPGAPMRKGKPKTMTNAENGKPISVCDARH